MISKKQVKEKYNKFAKWYDVLEGVYEIFILRRMRRELLKEAEGKVFEIGVGTGHNLKYYPKSCKITAVDFSQEMLKIARRKAERLGIDVDFRLMDAEKLEFKKGSFDTVVDSLGLCTYNSEKVLKEIMRVCKKKGKVLLLEHGKSSRESFARWQDKRAEKRAQMIGCYWNRNPLMMVEKAGLKVINSGRKFFGIFYVIQAEN